jgi:hypothetical protein
MLEPSAVEGKRQPLTRFLIGLLRGQSLASGYGIICGDGP